MRFFRDRDEGRVPCFVTKDWSDSLRSALPPQSRNSTPGGRKHAPHGENMGRPKKALSFSVRRVSIEVKPLSSVFWTMSSTSTFAPNSVPNRSLIRASSRGRYRSVTFSKAARSPLRDDEVAQRMPCERQ
jgi:hypothetical protein